MHHPRDSYMSNYSFSNSSRNYRYWNYFSSNVSSLWEAAIDARPPLLPLSSLVECKSAFSSDGFSLKCLHFFSAFVCGEIHHKGRSTREIHIKRALKWTRINRGKKASFYSFCRFSSCAIVRLDRFIFSQNHHRRITARTTLFSTRYHRSKWNFSWLQWWLCARRLAKP